MELAYPSLLAHRLSWQLLHPVAKMTADLPPSRHRASLVTSQSPSCSLHLLNLRTVGSATPTSGETAVIAHNVGRECALLPRAVRTCRESGDVADVLKLEGARKTWLNLQEKRTNKDDTKVEPMQVEAFLAKIVV